MGWSDEDVGRAWQEWRSTPTRDMDDALRRVMSLAVDLVATRGGTMTAEEIAEALHVREDEESGWWRALAPRLREHIVTQVATFQAKVAERDREISVWVTKHDERDSEVWATRRRANALEEERDALKLKVGELRKDAADAKTACERMSAALDDRRAEVERLKAELEKERALRRDDLAALAHDKQRAMTAESRLAAIRDLVQRVLATGQYMAQTLAGLTHHPALKAGGHVEAHGQINSDWADVATSLRVWLNAPAKALEGDAPQRKERLDVEASCPSK